MRSHLTIGLMLTVLAACGGGGGDAQPLQGKQATFTVGGSVSGLGSSGVVLELANLDNNQTETLTVTGDNIAGPRSFTFALGIASGARYTVSVRTPPIGLGCGIQNGSSTMGSAAVTNVAVACTSTNYNVGVSVTGLAGSDLLLRNNGGDDLTINSNGEFNFNTALTAGTAYAVTVHTQPSNPWQTCLVSNGSGSSTTGNVTNVTVNCTTNPYSVGGSVSGLVGTGLVLQINGGSSLPRSSNGAYSFNNIPSGTGYVVTVATQPTAPNQTCIVANGSNTVTNANVTNVAISCTNNQYTITGNAVGLAGTGLVLHNNGVANATWNGSAFSFPTQISGTTYNVTVFSQPSSPEQICTPSNNTGTVNANVSNITINCTTLPPMTVTASNPAASPQALNVARPVNPTIDFSVPLNIGTVAGGVTLASAAGSQTIGTSAAGNRITVLPQGRLIPQASYSLNVATTVRGQNGDRMASPFNLSFTTADGQWLGRGLVETDDTAAARNPKVAMNASGMAIATWVHGGTRILASRFVPETGSWSAAMPIASSDNGVFSPVVAIGPQGNALVVWVASDGMQQVLVQSRYSAANNTWTQPELLQFSVLGFVSSISIAASGTNDAVVGWIYSTAGFGGPSIHSVLVSRYNFSTDAWTSTPALTPGSSGSTDQHLSLATNVAGNISAVWVRSGDVLASHYNAANNTWSSLTTIDNIAQTAQMPRIAIDASGNAIAVWYQNDGVQTNIYANRYAVSTGQWGFASAIETNNAGTAISPQIAMDSLGNAVAIWHQSFNGTRFDVVANRYSISSNSWGTAGLIETLDVGDAGLAQLAIDPIGNTLAVWKYWDGARFNVMSNRFVARTGQWGTATPIETDPGDAGGVDAPSVVLDSTGSGIAVWSQSDGTRTNIYSNRFE